MDVILNSEHLAACEDLKHESCYVHLLTCLGYQQHKEPVADLLRQYHGLSGEWFVLSPVHWHATHNDAMITACGNLLGLSESQSRRWFDALSDALLETPFILHYHDAHTWLIQSSIHHPLSALPVHAVLQHSLMPHFSSLDSTGFWPRFITETQMLLSQHPLNHERNAQYPINGVWIWGAGQLHQKTDRPLICFDDVSLKMAYLLSTNVTRYQPGLKIDTKSVLLCLDQSSCKAISEERQLVKQLNQCTVHYYWNNLMQTIHAPAWWRRIGRIFSAH